MKSFKAAKLVVVVVLVLVFAWAIYLARRPSGLSVRNIRNIVLISIDTCRADYLSCYGYFRKTTPNIDGIAREGSLFTNVYSPIPQTLPAHSSMLTGTVPPYHGIHDNQDYILGKWNVTLAEILQQNGFATGAVIGAFVLDSKFGLDQGFDSYDDNLESRDGEPSVSYNERKGEEVTHQANLWMEEHAGDKFFLFLHYFDPHGPYKPPARFAFEYTDELYIGTVAYAGEVAYTDYCIGQVIEKLKELGLYDSTLVIITSDHGEMLREHSEDTHAYFIYQSAIKVPLIFKLPGQNKSKIIDHVVGLIDIVPTVCRLLDIEIPAQVQGKDLSGYFGRKQPQAQDRYIYCESMWATKYNANPLLGVVGQRWKYIQTTRPELYDIVEDPGETNNLIKQQPQQARILQDRLKQILEQSVNKSNSEGKVELDSESKRRLESLGYVAGVVGEDYEFDQTKDDPKDLIDFHNALFLARSFIYQRNQYDKAQPICDKMLQQHPDIFMVYLCVAKIAMLKEDFVAAVPHYAKALDLNPNSYEAHSNMGIALLELGQTEEAIKHQGIDSPWT